VSWYACERRVLAHDPGSNGERPVRRREAAALVASGHYVASSGAPFGADHWRRPLPDRSCLHLVLERRRCRLHHDAFDPHAGLLSLGLHAAHEARTEAAAFIALGCAVLGWLAEAR
jgi:hypothetical protein